MKYIFLLPLLALVVTVTIPTTAYAYQDPDEKADKQYEKGHVTQADNACEKGGYDGYIYGDCGYLS
jgi:hypothetical protein